MGASLGTARRNERARLQRIKEEPIISVIRITVLASQTMQNCKILSNSDGPPLAIKSGASLTCKTRQVP